MLDSNQSSQNEPSTPTTEVTPSQLRESTEEDSQLNRSRRRALGRGLGALLSSTDSPVQVLPTRLGVEKAHSISIDHAYSPTAQSLSPKNDLATAATAHTSLNPDSQMELKAEGHLRTTDGFCFLAPEVIIPNDKQPRKTFPEKDLQQLADSIRQSGLIQPVVVRIKQSETSGGLYEIVAGERRYRAAKLAGLSLIPAIVKSIGDRECLALSIVENIQRQDLNAIEEAFAYQRLMEEFGLTAAEVANEVGRDRSSIANSVRLLKLPESIHRDMIIGKLTAGHGRAILMVESLELQLALAERITDSSLSVRQAEDLARQIQSKAPKNNEDIKNILSSNRNNQKSPFILEIEERLRRALGTKLSLNLSDEGKGELRISFFSQDDLQNLIDKIGA